MRTCGRGRTRSKCETCSSGCSALYALRANEAEALGIDLPPPLAWWRFGGGQATPEILLLAAVGHIQGRQQPARTVLGGRQPSKPPPSGRSRKRAIER